MAQHRSPSRTGLIGLFVLSAFIVVLAQAESASAAGWSGYVVQDARAEGVYPDSTETYSDQFGYFFRRDRVVSDTRQVVSWKANHRTVLSDPDCSSGLRRNVNRGSGSGDGFLADIFLDDSVQTVSISIPEGVAPGATDTTMLYTDEFTNCDGEVFIFNQQEGPPCPFQAAGPAPQGTNTITVQATFPRSADSVGWCNGYGDDGNPNTVELGSASYYLTRDPNPPACANGIDDDGDGLTDYAGGIGLGDPGCGAQSGPPDPSAPTDPSEVDPGGSPVCGGASGGNVFTSIVDYGQDAIGGTWFPTIGKVLGPVGLGFGIVDAVCDVTDTGPSDPLLHGACGGLSGASVGLGIAGVVNIWNPGGWLALGGGALTGLTGHIVCDIDPPDPNFTVIAKPHKPDPLIPPIPDDNKWGSEPVRNAMTALNTNAARSVVTAEAMVHCIERAAGAKQAGNAYWEARQRQCASDYAAQLAQLYTNQKSIRTWLLRALQDWGVRSRTLTTEQIRAQLPKIRSTMNDLLSQVGASHVQINFVNAHLREAVYSVEGPGSIFNAIISPKMRGYLDDAATGFNRIARSYGSG